MSRNNKNLIDNNNDQDSAQSSSISGINMNSKAIVSFSDKMNSNSRDVDVDVDVGNRNDVIIRPTNVNHGIRRVKNSLFHRVTPKPPKNAGSIIENNLHTLSNNWNLRGGNDVSMDRTVLVIPSSSSGLSGSIKESADQQAQLHRDHYNDDFFFHMGISAISVFTVLSLISLCMLLVKKRR